MARAQRLPTPMPDGGSEAHIRDRGSLLDGRRDEGPRWGRVEAVVALLLEGAVEGGFESGVFEFEFLAP